MLAKSMLALGSFVLAAVACLTPQSGTVRGQDFTDCDLDIRPDNRPEVQVYWHEAPSGQKGMLFEMWAPADEVLVLGFPDGTHEIPLLKGVVNTATFIYDPARNEVTIETYNGTDREGPMIVPTLGTYNALLPLVEPTKTTVRPPAANKERILVSGKNYGIEFTYTLTRTVK
ncbi:MAG: hypothetical protein JNL28_10675 [Planctomycetes bacterium]|nr:hypothetical protein [Planctomycetota bacterium]